MKRTILLLLLLLPLQMIWAQTEKSFPQFTWIDANVGDKDGSRFGYEKASFTPILKNCQDLPQSDAYYQSEEYGVKVLLGRYKNTSMKEYVNIFYSPGPSVDPTFTITDQNNKEIWNEAAEEMCINANGVIYTSGNMNRMFNQRMKFQLANGKVTEAKQPFYYVGVKGKLLKPVKLYSQKNNLDELIATLPVGYEIEVLLAEMELPRTEYGQHTLPANYLVRTAFGLVGWLRLSKADMTMHDPVVRGLGFMGD